MSPAEPQASATPKATTLQKAVLLGMVFIALMIPPVLLLMLGVGGLTSLCVYGGVIAITAGFYDLRLSALLSVIAGASAFVAVLVHPYPLAGGLFMGLLAGGAALTAQRGLHSPVLVVPLAISITLTAPPTITDVSPGPATAVFAGLAMAACGLWVTGASRVILGERQPHFPTRPHGRSAAITYAAVMAVVVGLATWGVLAQGPIDHGGWLILTLVVILQPSTKDTVRKTLERLGGTVGGLAIALVLALVDLPPVLQLSMSAALLYCALASRFVLRLPYWVYVLLLTPAIILMNAKATSALDLVVERFAFTALGAVLAIGVAFAVKVVLIERHRRRAGDAVPS
ncbi:MAG: FUSC family protein [bacterium]